MSDLTGAIPSDAADEIHTPGFVQGKNNPLVVSKKMTAEKEDVNRRTRLSWSSRAEYKTPGDALNPPHQVPRDPKKILGRLDKKLPFMGPFFGYWVQNGQILKGNGQPIRLEEVPVKVKNVWIDNVTRLPVQGDDFPLRETVSAALDLWRGQAIKADPLMCPICYMPNPDPVAFSGHLYKAHRAQLAEAAGEEEAPAKAEAAPQSKKSSGAAQI